MNENGLPLSTLPPAPASFSVTYSVVTVDVDAVKKNVNCVPPSDDTSDGVPVPPPVENTGTAKSPARPTPEPTPSITTTVHEIDSPTRTNVVEPLDCPLHDSTDATVADDTLNENGSPPLISALFDAKASVTKNVVTVDVAAVKKNVKLDPPFPVTSDGVPVAPTPPVNAGAAKSDTRPVVTPADPTTLTVHDTASPTRTTVVSPLT